MGSLGMLVYSVMKNLGYSFEQTKNLAMSLSLKHPPNQVTVLYCK